MITYDPFPSQYITPRRVDVWLPPGYEEGEKRYPVLYMHDGQNVFDPQTSNTGIAWGPDETLTRLAAAGEASLAIVVGIWCTEQRYVEYLPAKPFDILPEAVREELHQKDGTPVSDDYLAFIVEELKPFIDATYRSNASQAQTFIMGASMGGVISLYAACEYPHIFGGAACLSTHWPFVEHVILPYLIAKLPDSATCRIYFDYGTVGAGLDAEYERCQQWVDRLMRAAGYEDGRTWITRKFPGEDHSERAWRERLEVPLRFLLGEIGE